MRLRGVWRWLADNIHWQVLEKPTALPSIDFSLESIRIQELKWTASSISRVCSLPCSCCRWNVLGFSVKLSKCQAALRNDCCCFLPFYFYIFRLSLLLHTVLLEFSCCVQKTLNEYWCKCILAKRETPFPIKRMQMWTPCSNPYLSPHLTYVCMVERRPRKQLWKTKAKIMDWAARKALAEPSPMCRRPAHFHAQAQTQGREPKRQAKKPF